MTHTPTSFAAPRGGDAFLVPRGFLPFMVAFREA
jgi:hypothetical protein